MQDQPVCWHIHPKLCFGLCREVIITQIPSIPKPFPTNRRDFSGWKKHLFLATCEILHVFLQKAISQLQDIFIQKFRKGNIDRKTPYFSFSFGAVIP